MKISWHRFPSLELVIRLACPARGDCLDCGNDCGVWIVLVPYRLAWRTL